MNLKHATRRSEQGFSLVELMVVIVILGILGTTVTVAFFPQIFKASRQKAIDTMLTLDQAIKMYSTDNQGRKPDTIEQLIEPNEISEKPYLDSTTIPLDPWGGEFQYQPPTSPFADDYDIVCYGADGVPGGDGQGLDLRLSEIKNPDLQRH